jgi:hypothetical protein
MIRFRLNLRLTLPPVDSCDVHTGEAVETEGSLIPDANADEEAVR